MILFALAVMSDLADSVGLTVRQLKHSFRQEYDKTPQVGHTQSPSLVLLNPDRAVFPSDERMDDD
eukprot:CAMPEP_0114451924 /NCGR_PEP_ID=MMETSP0104-20121206/1241_1 /TAXON_ID=37642 ORGANISM="Paraphysomonas imperforata, Strain PA2" /NCGR_SAMPLE_ID=MMETSP0104 /ASSEMBLY_ACC=CAM_ASM_000202 /LENGTH=64 /DNA_ID=CAMNT_0001624141 /DNA_START=300 /DNA_END=494 /DNA_ORIENTATION=+